MDKRRYRILTFLVFIFVIRVNAQQFDFESDKKQKSEYNKNTDLAISNNDLNSLRKILDKDPSLVNSYSKINNISKYNSLSSGKVPLLYDVLERYLDHSVSIEMLELVLKYKPFLNCSYEEKSPFYLILFKMATEGLNGNIQTAFNAFIKQENFNINQKLNNLSPPLLFLLEINLKHPDIQLPLDVYRTFFNYGASINSSTRERQSVISYAAEVNNIELFKFLIEKNADLSIIDFSNKDVLVNILKHNDFNSVRLLLDKKYPIDEIRLSSLNIKNEIFNADENIKDLLFNSLKHGIKNIDQLKILSNLFPTKKNYFIADSNFRSNLNINIKDIPDFVSLYKNDFFDSNSIEHKNLNLIKKEYVFSSKNIKELVESNKVFPILNLSIYKDDYYMNENSATELYNFIADYSAIPTSLRTSILNEIQNNKNSFYNNSLNGNITQLIHLYNNFESKKIEIEQKAFDVYIKPSYTSYYEFNSFDYYKDINSEILKLSATINNCTTFIGNFKTNTLIDVAKNKLQEAKRIKKIQDLKYEEAIDYYNNLCTNHRKLIDDIIENKPTPAYKIEKTEYNDDTAFYHIKINKNEGYFSNDTFEIKYRYNEYCVYSSFLIFSSNEFCSKNLDKTIKNYCIAKINLNSDDFVIKKEIVRFLRNNPSKWYEKNWW